MLFNILILFSVMFDHVINLSVLNELMNDFFSISPEGRIKDKVQVQV